MARARRTHHAGAARDQRDGDGDDDVVHAGAEDRHHRQRHDDQRKRHHHIADALERHVDPAAEIGAGDAQHQAGNAADEGRGQADDQRRARAENDAREQVAAELVGAEPVGPAWCLGHRVEVVGGWAVRGDPVGAEAGDRHDQHHRHAKGAERLAAAEVECQPQPGSAGRGFRFLGQGGDRRVARQRDGHDGALRQAKRMRGSSQPYSRSTTRLHSTKTVTVSITSAWVSV